MPGFPVHHQLPEITQTHVHRVSDAIQPSHPLSSPSPPTFNLSQHQGLFKWVSSSRQVAKYWSFSFSISPSNEYSGLISFRICSSSTGIPSPPLALFIMMLSKAQKNLVQCSSVTQSCLTLCDATDCSMPGFPDLHYLPEFAQIHVQWFSDAIQPSHPLLPLSPDFNLSQHQGLFQWVSSLHHVAKV